MEGDFTFDGSVSLADLSLLGGEWLQSVGSGGGGGMTLPAAAVPEPGTLVLVLSGLFGLGVVTLVRRQRRSKITAKMKGGSKVTTSDACGRVRRVATTLGVLAAVVALAASAHGEILVTGTNWEVSMSAPTPVGTGAESLVAVTLSVSNITGDAAFDPNAFGWHMKDGTELIGIQGQLHQEWGFGGGLPTPSMKPPFVGGPVGTPLDSHFLTENNLSPPGGDPQEDMTPGTSTEPPTPGYGNGFGTFLKGDFTDPDVSGTTWDFAYLVVPEGSLLDLDAVFAGGDQEERLTALDVVVGAPSENASKLLVPADLTPETRNETTGESVKTYNLPLLAPGALVRMDFAAALENIDAADTATYTATTTAGATSDLEGAGLTLGPQARVDGTLSLDLVAGGPIAESLTVSNTANAAGDANDVIQVLGNTDPGSAIIALIGDGAPYAGVGSTSDAGAGTVMQIVDGANLNSADETIEATWSPAVQPVVSDIVDLTGISGDLFALQMSYDPALLIAQYGGTEEEAEARAIENGRLFLGWNDGGLWRHLGDTTGDNIPDSPAVAGPYDNDLTLGHWGYDTAANTVWAVTDHNSQFAAVPEPGSLLMLLGAGLALAFAWRRRK